jgi:mRNA deadenylase 3'-5' endonuclease subunit Ccr4
MMANLRFVPSAVAPPPAAVAARLRVVSWNVLAERWTRDGQHDYIAAASAERQRLLDGDARTRRVLAALDALDAPPDVCCLQEVQRDARTGLLREWMEKRGYSGAWVAKTRRLRGAEAREAAARAAVLAGVGGGGMAGAATSATAAAAAAAAAAVEEDERISSNNSSGSEDGGSSGSGSEGEGGEGRRRRHDNEDAANDDEGVALIWRDASLECVSPVSAFRFADAAPASRLLSEFGDAAIAAVLRHRASGASLVAASAHLFWDPKRPEVKARQAGLLARRCASLARRHCGGGDKGEGMLPVVIGGDFNSMPPQELCGGEGEEGGEGGEGDGGQEAAVARAVRAAAAAVLPGSGVYRLLTTGTLPPSHPDHPFFVDAPAARRGRRRPAALSTRGLRLVTAHAAARGGTEPVLTTRTATFSGALDHIFVGPVAAERDQQQQQQEEGGSSSAPCWHVAATLALPDLKGPIPDAEWPSDHLPVGADLVLLRRRSESEKI